MNRTYDNYLLSFKEGIARARVRSTLEKRVNASGHMTSERAIVDDMIGRGEVRLTFSSMTGKKRDGLRLPLKPKWSIFAGDSDYGITRTAALYANYLLGDVYDFKAIEEKVTAEYERVIADSKPSRGWGGPL